MADKKLEEYLKKFDWLWEDNTPLCSKKPIIIKSKQKTR